LSALKSLEKNFRLGNLLGIFSVSLLNTKYTNMKTTWFILALLIGTTGFGQTKQTRDVCCFNSVRVSGAFEVFLRMGEKSSVTVVADEDIIDDINTKVDGDVLEVDFDSDWWNWGKKSNDAKIYITLSSVESLEFSGACEVKGKNSLRGNTIDVECSGASELNLEFDCDQLNLDLSGASELTLRGKSRKVNLESSGASEINAADLQAKSMNMDVSGASSASVNVSDDLNIEASGASEVRYKGSPNITQEVSGASSISKL
jgi:hypothetical protein